MYVSAAEEAFNVSLLYAFQCLDVLDRQLGESLSESGQANAGRSVSHPKLLRQITKGYVPPDADHHDDFLLTHLASGFRRKLGDRRAKRSMPLCIQRVRSPHSVFGVALGHDPLSGVA